MGKAGSSSRSGMASGYSSSARGDEIFIQSRDGKLLNRYFPEVEEALQEQLAKDCTLDGEIVIAGSSGLDFDALQLRIHPAASRVKLLSQQTPASVVFFDLLSQGRTDLRGNRSHCAAKNCKLFYLPRRLRSISLRPRANAPRPRIGFIALKERVWMASWRSEPLEPMSQTNASC